MHTLRHRCCSAVNINPNSKKGDLIETAAGIADAWYEAHPMPCGSYESLDRHHRRCGAHVGSEIRMACGVLTFISVFSCILSLCYTVWSWRRELKKDAEPRP
jgi:hypothetical protein